MNATTPLHIPEIIASVGSFLSLSDQIRCARVCSLWNVVFQPLIWNTVSIVGKNSAEVSVLAPQSRHFRSLFLSRNISGQLCRFLRSSIQGQLTSLEIDALQGIGPFTVRGRHIDHWPDIVALAANNRHTLQSLNLLSLDMASTETINHFLNPRRIVGDGQGQSDSDTLLSVDSVNDTLPITLSQPGYTNLRHLLIESVPLRDIQHIESIMTLCQKLESLALKSLVLLQNESSFMPLDQRLEPGSIMYQLLYTNNPGRAGLHRLPYNRPIEYPYLRKLNLYRIAGCDSSAYWAWFIAPCSGLQSLMWGGSPGQKFPTDLACATSVQCHEEHTMAGQYWNFWERLEEFIFTGNCAGIEDQCFERVFERQIMAHEQEDKRTHEAGHYHHSWSGQSKTLIKLLVSNSGFGPLALSAFMGMGHHLTIRRLNFLDCKHVSSTMVLDLLTVCPVLESFSADRVLGEDVFKDGRPWVCTKLKRLELFFDMSSPTLLPECLLLYIYGGIPLYDKEDNGNSENCQEAKVQLATRDMVYTRLATLTELEIMLLERRKFVTSLSYPSQPQDVQSAMQEAVHVLHGSLFFMLREGLDKLRTLKRLRYTSVMDEPYLGEPELIWVKEHWPKVVDANDIRYWSYHTVVVRDLLASLIKKSMENNTA